MADLSPGRLSPDRMDDFDDETLDPRIQVELERLNKASEEINKLELELDDARAAFRQALSDSTQRLNALNKKLGASVEKARPYYDARVKMKDAHVDSQKAALRFERACSMHEAAKEMVQLAEQGYIRREHASDPAWQEMLNHATMKVNDAEKERNESETEHKRLMQIFLEADTKVQFLQRDLKRNINKSKPYFEMKAKFNQTMEDQKRSISILEEDVRSAKNMYSEALKNLEIISEAIHQQRVEKRKQLELGIREAGVGSESPSPPPIRGQVHQIEGKKSVHTSSCQSHSLPRSISIRRKSSGELTYTLPSVIHKDLSRARTPSYKSAVNRQDSTTNEDDLSVQMMEDNVIAHNTSSQRRDSQTAESKPVPQDKQKKKLQGGVILCINAQMDPLTQQYQTMEMKPTRQLGQKDPPAMKHSDDSPFKTPAPRPIPSSGVPKNLEFSKSNPFGLPYMKPPASSSMSVSSTEGSRKSLVLTSPTLSIPTPSEAEDNSDAESILSGGPMLDDDQVQFLTMEFSDQASMDSQKTEDETQWTSQTLPATLSHLEQYLRLTKISTSSEDEDPQLRKSEDHESSTEVSANPHATEQVESVENMTDEEGQNCVNEQNECKPVEKHTTAEKNHELETDIYHSDNEDVDKTSETETYTKCDDNYSDSERTS